MGEQVAHLFLLIIDILTLEALYPYEPPTLFSVIEAQIDEMLMIAALEQDIGWSTSASAATFNKGMKACK